MKQDLPIEMLETADQLAVATPEARAALALNASQTERDLIELAGKHTALVLVKDKTDREQVHGAAMEIKRARVTIERVAKEARDDATKFSKAVIAEENRLVALVQPEETRLLGLRDAWDDEQERIKREAEEKERARILALGARIQAMRDVGALAMECRTSDAVMRLLGRFNDMDLTGFEEFEPESKQVYSEVLIQIQQVHNSRLAMEAEAARLKAEREELAAQQAQAKREQEARDAAQREEAAKLAQERAEFARQQQEAADKLAAQQAEVARQLAELDAAKVAAQQTEIDRQLAEDLAAQRDAAHAESVRQQQEAAQDLEQRRDAIVTETLVLTEETTSVAITAPAVTTDTGDCLTLGQINERLAPVAISVAGLAQLGFEPAAQVKASRLYRACDLPAIAHAIARHVVAAAA